ncbi:MAG: peptidylprolyl isomerase [Desulfovibrio sp.]|nr:peptidylprolyl isomerase [Desulfovibrio sp.]
MLESIRSGAQSFGVKIAFGIIILVFVFWGVGNFNDRDYSNVVAVVNGEPILAREFEKAYHAEEEYLLRTNPGLTRQQLSKMDLGSRVLNELIRLTLLSQEAKRAGIEITPREMREVVAQDAAFQDESGKFDADAYKRVLEARRMTPGQYEKELSTQMLGARMAGLVTAAAWVDPEEARRMFDFLRERRVIDYLFIPSARFISEARITETAAKDWYENHKGQFSIPAQVDVAYIRVAPEDLVDAKSISEAAAREWYEANKSKFEKPERIHPRHILVTLAPDASEQQVREAEAKLATVRKQLGEGQSFAELADSINPPQAADKGGDLGWIGRGQTVPQFEEAAFALPVGQVSDPVRTDFGLHLILVEEKQEAGVAPFEEAAQEAYKTIAFEQGSDKIHEALDNLIEDNILQKPLAEAAARYNLKPEQTGLLDRAGLIQKLGVKPEGADALLAMSEGAPVDTALEAGDAYIIARIVKTRPEGIKGFSEVRNEIEAALAREAALKLALADGESQLRKYEQEKPASLEQSGFKTSAPLEREGVLPGFAPDEKLIHTIFDTKVDNWLATPFPVTSEKEGTGALIARVMRIVPPEPGEFAAAGEILENAMRQERKAGIFQIFIEDLYRKAIPIKINKDIVDRITMQGL